MHKIWTVTIGLAATLACAGPVSKTKEAVDPDCTVGEAAKGAAERATVGVGNRCKPAETARDVVGVDGKKSGAKQAAAKKRSKD